MQELTDGQLIKSLQQSTRTWRLAYSAADRCANSSANDCQTNDPEALFLAIKARAETSQVCATFLTTAGEIISGKSSAFKKDEFSSYDLINFAKTVFADSRISQLTL